MMPNISSNLRSKHGFHLKISFIAFLCRILVPKQSPRDAMNLFKKYERTYSENISTEYEKPSRDIDNHASLIVLRILYCMFMSKGYLNIKIILTRLACSQKFFGHLANK